MERGHTHTHTLTHALSHVHTHSHTSACTHARRDAKGKQSRSRIPPPEGDASRKCGGEQRQPQGSLEVASGWKETPVNTGRRAGTEPGAPG